MTQLNNNYCTQQLSKRIQQYHGALFHYPHNSASVGSECITITTMEEN